MFETNFVVLIEKMSIFIQLVSFLCYENTIYQVKSELMKLYSADAYGIVPSWLCNEIRWNIFSEWKQENHFLSI